MFNRRKLVLWCAVASFALPLIAKQHNRKDVPPKESTFSGMVEKVEQRNCEICNCVEITLMLKTKTDRLEVRLGPKSYLEERDFFISRGDSIDISGVQFKERGKVVVLASEVRKGGETLNLRGKFGRPAWMSHGHTCPVCGN